MAGLATLCRFGRSHENRHQFVSFTNESNDLGVSGQRDVLGRCEYSSCGDSCTYVVNHNGYCAGGSYECGSSGGASTTVSELDYSSRCSGSSIAAGYCSSEYQCYGQGDDGCGGVYNLLSSMELGSGRSMKTIL